MNEVKIPQRHWGNVKSKFCSDKCRNDYANRNRAKTGFIKQKIPCMSCKVEIIQDHPNRRLCSDCAIARTKKKNAMHSERRKSRQNIEMSCKMCGKQFIAHRRHRKFCSDYCRGKRLHILARVRNYKSKIKKMSETVTQLEKLL